MIDRTQTKYSVYFFYTCIFVQIRTFFEIRAELNVIQGHIVVVILYFRENISMYMSMRSTLPKIFSYVHSEHRDRYMHFSLHDITRIFTVMVYRSTK